MATRTSPHETVAAIPHPARRLPLIGDVLAIDTKAPTQSEFELSRKLGPLYELKFGPKKMLVIASGSHAQQVNDEKAWRKLVAGPFISMRRHLTGLGLFTVGSSDPLWSHANTVLSPAFAQSAMRSYHTAMAESVADLCTLWSAAADPVDVPSDMSRLTLEVIARAGFSTGLGALEPDYDFEFTRALTGAFTNLSREANDLPFTGLLNRSRARELRDDTDRLKSFARNVVDDRIRTGERHEDLLDMMLNGNADAAALPRDNVVDQVLTFLAAGNDTTANLLSFCLYYLSRDDALADAVRSEVSAVAGDGPISFEQVPKMRLIRRIIDESLRLWPVAPGYFRKATTDQTLGGHEISSGTVAFVLTLGVHRDPETWGPNADEFDPARFEPTRDRHPDRVFKPFGTGPRACIGRQFALHEATLAIAELSRRFTFERDPGYELDIYEMLTLKPQGFTLRVRETPNN